MKNLILAIALTITSSAVMADWEHLVEYTDGEYTVYADPGLLKFKGNIAKSWFLFDYRSAQDFLVLKKYMSSQVLMEFNCGDDTQRSTFIANYSKAMGGGDQVETWNLSNAKFIPIISGSVDSFMFRNSCKQIVGKAG